MIAYVLVLGHIFSTESFFNLNLTNTFFLKGTFMNLMIGSGYKKIIYFFLFPCSSFSNFLEGGDWNIYTLVLV